MAVFIRNTAHMTHLNAAACEFLLEIQKNINLALIFHLRLKTSIDSFEESCNFKISDILVFF